MAGDAAQKGPLPFVNHALALLGETPIEDFDPESGSTNALAGLIYDRVVESCLSTWLWNFATCRVELSQLSDDPPLPWTVQYSLPSGCLRVIRTDHPNEPFAVYSDNRTGVSAGTPRPAGAMVLYAHRTGIIADCIVRPLDEIFPAYFTDLLVNRLAAEMAPAITGSLGLAQGFEQRARVAEARARTVDASLAPPRSISRGREDPRGDGSEGLTLMDRGGW